MADASVIGILAYESTIHVITFSFTFLRRLSILASLYAELLLSRTSPSIVVDLFSSIWILNIFEAMP
jgi:hypothetical protein